MSLSVLLHKLRSPLTAIGGFTESLALQSQRGTLTDERLIDRLGRIRVAAERIDQLLDDLEATLAHEHTASG